MKPTLLRRDFFKLGGVAIGAAAAIGLTRPLSALGAKPQGSSDVFFTDDISPDGLMKIYDRIRQRVSGKVAIKLHTGEPNGPNILPRDMVSALQRRITDSTLVETNTLYKGKRYTTADHRETLKVNGWDFGPVDILDEDGAAMIPVKGGRHFTEMSVGKHLLDYDSLVVLTHFKGHAMGGFGGSMKNIAIGCADGRIGKKMVRTHPTLRCSPCRRTRTHTSDRFSLPDLRTATAYFF